MNDAYELTEKEQACLSELLQLVMKECDKDELTKGQDRNKLCDKEHLIRQLKAREFDVQKAFEMWQKWVAWRKEYDFDQIYTETILKELKSGKAFWHKYDKVGNPCCVVRIKNHIAADTTNMQTIKFMIFLMQTGITMADKSGTKKMCVLWDREGFSSKNFDRTFITLMKQLVVMFQDNYAERLAKVYVLHPSFVMRSAFNLFKPFLADKVKSKIFILEDVKQLKEHFDEDSILKIHGGTSEFEYSYPNKYVCDPLYAIESDYLLNKSKEYQQQQKKSAMSPTIDPFQTPTAHYSNKVQDQQTEEFEDIASAQDYQSIDNNSTEFFNLEVYSMKSQSYQQSPSVSYSSIQYNKNGKKRNKFSKNGEGKESFYSHDQICFEGEQNGWENSQDKYIDSAKLPYQSPVISSGCFCSNGQSRSCNIF